MTDIRNGDESLPYAAHFPAPYAETKRIAEAEFVIHVEPSDLGFASLVPDAVFAVHALTDETQDQWDETQLSWSQAPAHDERPPRALPHGRARARGLPRR